MRLRSSLSDYPVFISLKRWLSSVDSQARSLSSSYDASIVMKDGAVDRYTLVRVVVEAASLICKEDWRLITKTIDDKFGAEVSWMV
jgi:hypothetical protein